MYSLFEASESLSPVLYFCKSDLAFNKLFSEVSGFFWSLFSSGCVFPLVTLYMLLPPPLKLGLIKIRIAGTCLVLLREREKE